LREHIKSMIEGGEFDDEKAENSEMNLVKQKSKEIVVEKKS